ncbi:hypothetical protein [Domibacillus sp.]|uniref:hypothetical protein n=1 Tax=Domibacillus sp. TaxID=1969783 RepID=UPI002812746B|nr:hypothetical protein [Domibacillus sp.]
MDSMLKKKFAAGGVTMFLTIGALAGCGGSEEETDTDTEEMETEETETEDEEESN